jgi:hypothetical protein
LGFQTTFGECNRLDIDGKAKRFSLLLPFQRKTMYFVDRTAVVLKPTARFLEWLKSADENMPDLTTEQIRANCSVFLVPQFDEPEEVISYFDERYQQIFEAELAGWDIDKSKWPQDMSLKAFWEFFDTEIHDMVLDMEEAELSITPVFDNMM